MLGPWRAALVGILVDILGNFFRGETGQFFIGYTLTALVGGLIYGYFLYKKTTQMGTNLYDSITRHNRL